MKHLQLFTQDSLIITLGEKTNIKFRSKFAVELFYALGYHLTCVLPPDTYLIDSKPDADLKMFTPKNFSPLMRFHAICCLNKKEVVGNVMSSLFAYLQEFPMVCDFSQINGSDKYIEELSFALSVHPTIRTFVYHKILGIDPWKAISNLFSCKNPIQKIIVSKPISDQFKNFARCFKNNTFDSLECITFKDIDLKANEISRLKRLLKVTKVKAIEFESCIRTLSMEVFVSQFSKLKNLQNLQKLIIHPTTVFYLILFLSTF